ncbi:MAG: DUF1573 domain-containing protein [Nitrospirota bacterium]|nr:DUF1573 domain-containing protein [Nitrospirota bacterium]
MHRLLPMALAALCLTILHACAGLAVTEDAPPGTTAQAVVGPRLQFENLEHHFGTITQGKLVEHRFPFTNVGDQDLTISEVSTPCGCTAVLADQEVVPPGSSSFVDVTYDSAARSGEVVRIITVISNDAEQPEMELKVVAQVDASQHAGFMVGDTLFGPKCGSCHYDTAAEKSGQELYDAVCWFCHGTHRQGNTATALDAYQPAMDGYLRKVISDGLPGTEMPGFARNHEGPLFPEQIDSLVDLLHDPPPPPPDPEPGVEEEPKDGFDPSRPFFQ